MSNTWHRTALYVGLVFSWSLGVAGDLPSGEAPGGDLEELVLEVEHAKERYLLYEPVDVTIRIRNPSSRAIRSISPLLDVGIRIQKDGGEWQAYRSGQHPGIMPSYVTLKPGDVSQESKVLFRNASVEALAFPAVGRYLVRAVTSVGDAEESVVLEAVGTSIEVRAPTAADEALIQALGSVEELQSILQTGVWAVCTVHEARACHERLSGVIEANLSSVYAPWIQYYLAGALHGVRGEDQEHGVVAVDMMRSFLQRWPDHSAAPPVIYRLVFALRKMGRKSEAVAWVDVYERKYPNRVKQIRQMRRDIERELGP